MEPWECLSQPLHTDEWLLSAEPREVPKYMDHIPPLGHSEQWTGTDEHKERIQAECSSFAARAGGF